MWQSKRLHQVVKSTMASETLTQVKVAEAAFWAAKLYSEVTGNYLLRKTSEKKEIKEIKWVNSNTQLANSLTKRGVSSDLLINVPSIGKLH